MPRPKIPPPATPVVTLDHGAVSRATAAVDQLGYSDAEAHEKTAQLAQRLDYDGPLDPDNLQHTARLHMGRTVEESLGLGRALLLLKERVPHGDFERRLEAIRMAPRAARKFMQAALKFGRRPATVEAAATATKLIELLVLDDPDLDQLEGDGSALDITLDDVARMTRNELRSRLRDARELLKAKDKLLETKNAKIDKLVMRQQKAADDEAEAVRQRIGDWQGFVREAYGQLEIGKRVAAACTSEDSVQRRSCELVMKQGLEWLVSVLRELRDIVGVEVDCDINPQIPDWIDILGAKSPGRAGSATEELA